MTNVGFDGGGPHKMLSFLSSLRSCFNAVGVGLRHELQTAAQQHLCQS